MSLSIKSRLYNLIEKLQLELKSFKIFVTVNLIFKNQIEIARLGNLKVGMQIILEQTLVSEYIENTFSKLEQEFSDI